MQSIDPAWSPALERRFFEWCQTKHEMDPTYAAAVGQHVHWLLRRLRAAGLGPAAAEQEGKAEGTVRVCCMIVVD